MIPAPVVSIFGIPTIFLVIEVKGLGIHHPSFLSLLLTDEHLTPRQCYLLTVLETHLLSGPHTLVPFQLCLQANACHHHQSGASETYLLSSVSTFDMFMTP